MREIKRIAGKKVQTWAVSVVEENGGFKTTLYSVEWQAIEAMAKALVCGGMPSCVAKNIDGAGEAVGLGLVSWTRK